MSVALSGVVVRLRFIVEHLTAKSRGAVTSLEISHPMLITLLFAATNDEWTPQTNNRSNNTATSVERHMWHSRRCVETVLTLYAVRQWRVVRLPCELNGAGVWSGWDRLG